jgi:uncharacterized membrane protein
MGECQQKLSAEIRLVNKTSFVTWLSGVAIICIIEVKPLN